MQRDQVPHVVILGGGFAGLYAAKSLRKARVRVTLIDKANYHLFQPLLYEVATAALSPAEIAAPIRKVLSKQANATVLLGHAKDVDTARQVVMLDDGEIGYDFLIVATGARHSYFGKSNWAAFAPGLKTIDDALEIRRRFLLAFEAAEREADPASRRAKLTFIVVGAGPTGVEMAGTMSEVARRGIPRDFRSIDTSTARVILVEAVDRVLPAYPPNLSAKAKAALERLGVEVMLNRRVMEIDGEGVSVARADDGQSRQRIDAENVIWAAGVQASAMGSKLGVPIDKNGRVFVEADLTIPGHRNVFVIGDLAKVADLETKVEVPGVAPAAIQMGKYVAKVIRDEASGRSKASDRKPFKYFNKGMLATIGRGKAVAWFKRVQFQGTIAWLLWVFVHIMYLIGFRNRLMVMMQWAWTYVAFARGARIITGPVNLDLRRPRAGADEPMALDLVENRFSEIDESAISAAGGDGS
jgi:NADH:ubiquinone reductase (H+-translocating)